MMNATNIYASSTEVGFRLCSYAITEYCVTFTTFTIDLKPDNIGFTKDMKLKVFDFGLATCIGRSGHSNQVYKLTGCTGTLRYMAPEVCPMMRSMYYCIVFAEYHFVLLFLFGYRSSFCKL